MKSLALVIAYLAPSSMALAADPKLVPVNNISIELSEPCTGSPRCEPPVRVVTFTVPWGGSCHSYYAKVNPTDEGTDLSILDFTMENCTRPEVKNYGTSVVIRNVYKAPFKLANPLYDQGE